MEKIRELLTEWLNEEQPKTAPEDTKTKEAAANGNMRRPHK